MNALVEEISASHLSQAWLKVAWDIAPRELLLLVVAGLTLLVLRRASAATRHLAWTATLASLLALPLLSALLPGWTVPGLPVLLSTPNEASFAPQEGSSPPLLRSSATVPTPTAGLSPVDPATTVPSGPVSLLPDLQTVETAGRPWQMWAFALWLTGVLLVFARFALGTAWLLRLTRRAQLITEDEWLAHGRKLASQLGLFRLPLMYFSGRATMPLTWGIRRPIVLLPAEAADWTVEQRQIVLLHEFAHIKRRDCLTQLFALFACALYWFNPLVWLVARYHRMDRERACDDQVIQSGARPSVYAEALLEMARSLGRTQFGSFAMVSIARRSQLEGRLLAILDPHTNRKGVTRRSALIAVALGLVIVIPFASAQSPGRKEQQTAPPKLPVEASTPSLPIPPRSAVSAEKRTRSVDETRGRESAQETETEVDLDEIVTAAPNPVPAPRPRPAASRTLSSALGEALGETLGETLSQTLSTTLSTKIAEAFNTSSSSSFSSSEGGADYLDALQALGYGDLPIDKITKMKLMGVTPAFIRQMKALGYDHLSPDQLVKLRSQGVTPAYIGQMKSALKRLPTADELVSLRVQGVTPETVRETRSTFGEDVSLETIRRFKIHGVTPQLASELETEGYRDLSTDQLVSVKIQGVTPEYIHAIREIGYPNASIERIVSLKTQGVTPEYIQEMNQFFGTSLSLEQICQTRVSGLTPEYVNRLAAIGFSNTPVEKLISAKLQGVTPTYIQAMQEQGYDKLSLGEYQRAKTMGVTPEFIAAAKERGLKDLTLKQLIALKMAGILKR